MSKTNCSIQVVVKIWSVFGIFTIDLVLVQSLMSGVGYTAYVQMVDFLPFHALITKFGCIPRERIRLITFHVLLAVKMILQRMVGF